jgi:hypothetical protein
MPTMWSALGFVETRAVVNQAATVATCWSAQYAASYSAGGRSPQAEWRRRVFHQWTHSDVASSTCSMLRQDPRRWISSAL